MRIRGLKGLVVTALLAVASVTAARASEVLYDGTGLLRGTQAGVQSFDLSGPGTITVTLTNQDWPAPLATLDVLMSSAGGSLGPAMAPGSETFSITSGGLYFAHWFGTAQGPLGVGAYGLLVTFQPSSVGSGTTVPLPASLALLLSGLALLAWQRRHAGPDGALAAG